MQRLIQDWLKKQEDHSYAEGRLRQMEYDWEQASEAPSRAKLTDSLNEQRRAVSVSQQTVAGLAQRIAQSLDAKQYAEGRRTNLLNQLNEIIDKLHPTATNQKLSRNQSMTIDNYLFRRIYLMLQRAIESEYMVHEIPEFMYADDSRFDETQLRNYLVAMTDELLKLPLNSFLDLHSYLQRKEEGFFALTKE
ncbi:MAG: hypothetical protein EOO60_13245 [Hymenobacter sp.]|nr:MAG: hypothetical protein EOO60_13245 [Hymenobacter sp.]